MIGKGVGVVVFGEDVVEAAVDGGFGVVEFGDVAVLEPVDEHFAAEDYQEGKQVDEVAGPVGEHREDLREDAG